uniref:Ribosomal protein S8 n=2 Tax=Reclinomonas americana TaxID=48483 RepID=M4QE72_RECAM|nr:ribosomal protein S8 [Reclinomonas americana ATCC 50633]AGH24410.1 ribosomal protein S8 [Reclinomonas americana ATCC 50284]
MTQIQSIHSLISNIKQGQKNNLSNINVIYSKLNIDILNVLYEEGYISDFEIKKNADNKDIISVRLKYYNNISAIRNIQRVINKHISLKLLNQIDLGLVTYILSTSKGIFSGKEARRLNLGGTILLIVW